MTRFARASGSKASNQRVPEDSTPWYLMKQQVTDKDDSEVTQEKDTDWKNILDSEKKIEENKNSVWCEFEAEKPKEKSKNTVDKCKTQESKQSRKRCSEENNSISSPLNIERKKKKGKLSSKNQDNILNLDSSIKIKDSGLKHVKSKLKLHAIKTTFIVEEFSDGKTEESPAKNEFHTSSEIEKLPISSINGIVGLENENVSKGNNCLPEKKEHKDRFSKSQDKNQLYSPGNQNIVNEGNEIQDSDIKEELSASKLAPKDDIDENKNRNCLKKNTITWQNRNKQEKPYKRRKLDEGDVKLEVNGQEIWVTRLDGFYIKKDDAERIRQLEKDLLKRGVSKQEVRAVVKKERRNAEKSLARQKKKVCYHCRKGGHTLSACPMLEESGAQVVGSGICYKCGSTEHTHFQCKVNSGNTYKFATCFVCKQEGHISKQCPDNPRGVYPTGGGCRLCGDVTHFRRECPTLQTKANKVTVGIIDHDVETLDGQCNTPASKEPANKRKNKIVKFS